MSPGDRPDLPLAEEPVLGLRPPRTGSGARGGVQPVAGPFALEEEPALWPSVTGAAPGPLPGRAPRARDVVARRPAPVLPATGGGVGAAAGLLLLAATVLRWRGRRLTG